MSNILVRKTDILSGRVSVSGAKNAVLPIMAAALLTDEKSVILNVPNLSDVRLMQNLLKNMGCGISVHKDRLTIKNSENITDIAPYELINKMRGSFLLSGAVLAKKGHIQISLPGGCPIGTRPIDLHLKGFSALGADITQCHGYIDITAPKLCGAKIYLDFPSVGATENIMMASCLADGETIIENAAAEPEIVDLADFLRRMGAVIIGDGSNTIKIIGVPELHGTTHTVIPDRIEAGTFMIAAAITGSHIFIDNIIPAHIKPITAKLREMGAVINENDTSIEINSRSPLCSTTIKTMPFPGFPTDMQAQFTALMSVAEGTGVIVETIFENRFLHAAELNRMGADIKIDGRTAVVTGGQTLTGASVSATDLRAGASLILAGLAAHGSTQICNTNHIERGYDDIVGKLQALGADIERTK